MRDIDVIEGPTAPPEADFDRVTFPLKFLIGMGVVFCKVDYFTKQRFKISFDESRREGKRRMKN